MKKIGLYGGSFDPIHRAHIALSLTACEALQLDEVQLVPAGNPWQRAPLLASGAQRAEMIRLAIQDHPQLRLNTIELERDGPTYTIDTVNALASGGHYFWILGADQLSNFTTWRDWRGIVDCVDLAIACRPGSSLEAPSELAAHLQAQGRTLTVVPFSPTELSSSSIRNHVAEGRDIEKMVSQPIQTYIQSQGLYRNTA